MSFYRELKRRNVFRVAIAYLAAAWLLTEVAGTLFPGFGIPDWAFRFVVIVLAIGFPPTLIFSWAYEMTPEGLKRETEVVRDVSITHLTAQRLDRITIGLIVLAIAFIVADRVWLSPRVTQQVEVPTASESEPKKTLEQGPVESLHPPNSIAVLPFVNMSADAANEYFSDGISEELLNLLAKIPELRVIARTSSFAYKGKDVKITDVANELNVSHILEGSVRKAGNQVRITAQLIRTSDSSHLWSETFDRDLDNIFVVQDEIAAAVVGQLKVKLLGDAPETYVVDPEAYALFLQARYFANLGTIAGTEQATEYLQQTLAIAPDYSEAWSDLGRNYQNKAANRQLDEEFAYSKAQEAQNKALELDPRNAVAYSRLGFDQLQFYGDLSAAAKLFERALALQPGNAIVLANAASLTFTLGRMEQSVRLWELAQQLDPLNSSYAFGLARAYFMNDELDKAEAMFRKSLLLSPNRRGTRAALVRVMNRKDESSDPEEVRRLIAEEPVVPLQLIATASMHYKVGNVAESDAALKTLVEDFHQRAGMVIAMAYTIRGETEKAFEWLQKTLELEGQQALYNTWYSPEFEILHDDPRWEQLLAGAGLSKQQLSSIDFEFQLP